MLYRESSGEFKSALYSVGKVSTASILQQTYCFHLFSTKLVGGTVVTWMRFSDFSIIF